MRLGYVNENGRNLIALGHADQWLDFTRVTQAHSDQFPWLRLCPQPTVVDLLENTPDLVRTMGEWFTRLTKTGEIEAYLIKGQIQFLAPVTRASKILALGRNYRAHAEEGGYPVPDEPIFFAKASSSVIGAGADIVYPDGVQRLDPEVELAVVIGQKAKAIPEEHAMEYVAGYTIVNDVTARDTQRNDIQKGKPWLRSKSFDTFCPIGPYIVLTDEITDPHNLELTLRVNGETRQRSNTAMCLFKIPYLIAYISKHMTLEPGDVIATGTPEGIAPIHRGDFVECSIAGIGSLVNRVV